MPDQRLVRLPIGFAQGAKVGTLYKLKHFPAKIVDSRVTHLAIYVGQMPAYFLQFANNNTL